MRANVYGVSLAFWNLAKLNPSIGANRSCICGTPRWNPEACYIVHFLRCLEETILYRNAVL
jgi:hypothetical protein